MPCNQPPWGEMVAVNVNTGDIAWRVPLGVTDRFASLICLQTRAMMTSLRALALRLAHHPAYCISTYP